MKNNKFVSLSDFKNTLVINAFNGKMIEKAEHKVHKYIRKEGGKYIYDYNKMNAKEHEDASWEHHIQHIVNDTKAEGRKMAKDKELEEHYRKHAAYHKEEKEKHTKLAEEKSGNTKDDYSNWSEDKHRKQASFHKEQSLNKKLSKEEREKHYGLTIEHAELADKKKNQTKENEERKKINESKTSLIKLNDNDFINHIENELDWNNASVSKLTDKDKELEGNFDYKYTCLPGQSVISDIKEAANKIGFRIKVKRTGDQSRKAFEHEYLIKILDKENNINDFLGNKKELGVTKHGDIKKSEAFDILIPADFEERLEKSKGPWKKGKKMHSEEGDHQFKKPAISDRSKKLLEGNEDASEAAYQKKTTAQNKSSDELKKLAREHPTLDVLAHDFKINDDEIRVCVTKASYSQLGSTRKFLQEQGFNVKGGEVSAEAGPDYQVLIYKRV